MPSYGKTSRERLSTCHSDLQRLFMRVIERYDCSILCGHRDEIAQNEAYLSGHSKLRWPESKHNKTPSLAVDAAPYPIDWDDRERFCLFAGYVLGVAEEMGIKIRWGGDWNGNHRTKDERQIDMPHFELI